MLKLEYKPLTGEAVRDAMVEELARGFIPYSKRAHEITLVYATENIFYATRILVQEGEIEPDNIKFQFQGQDIEVDRKGNLSSWPPGFCDYTDKWLEKLIGWNSR